MREQEPPKPINLRELAAKNFKDWARRQQDDIDCQVFRVMAGIGMDFDRSKYGAIAIDVRTEEDMDFRMASPKFIAARLVERCIREVDL